MPITLTLVLITAALSLYGLFRDPIVIERLMLRPYDAFASRRFYTLLTSGFVHADLQHLLFNMFSFFFFATRVEYFLGGWRFLILYLGSIIMANVPTLFEEQWNDSYASLGASGGVAATIFSAILYDPSMQIYLFLIPIGIPGPLFGLLFLAYDYFSSRRMRDGINHTAHLWGAFWGIAFTLLLDSGVRTILFDQISSTLAR